MKTVKRKAEVGEKIVGKHSGRVYEVESVLSHWAQVKGGGVVSDGLYEVIIEDEPDIPPHSSHYHPGSIDVIRFAEENFSVEERRGLYRMSALRYLTRFDRKGSATDDLEKAQFDTGKLLGLERHDQP